MFNPPHPNVGDFGYSSEAINEATTHPMEAQPQSKAAPPASTEALANLNRRHVDVTMLNGDPETQCAICIDDMKVGDKAAILPCKHWFHAECVITHARSAEGPLRSLSRDLVISVCHSRMVAGLTGLDRFQLLKQGYLALQAKVGASGNTMSL
ncbi:hypothetical protein V8C42DRAFT_258837 [Trichoderma barbatum]